VTGSHESLSRLKASTVLKLAWPLLSHSHLLRQGFGVA
jgi:hypothetical protein